MGAGFGTIKIIRLLTGTLEVGKNRCVVNPFFIERSPVKIWRHIVKSYDKSLFTLEYGNKNFL